MKAINKFALDKTSQHAPKPNRRLLLPHLPLQFDDKHSAKRAVVEQFIAARFEHHYQASISHFLPYLLSTQNEGKLAAAIGFHAASDSPLFLEQYLANTIEHQVSNIANTAVARDKIAEIGNLTSSFRGTSQLLFVIIVAVLHEAGFEWAVFTATRQVQHLLSRLDLNTVTLCEANPALLDTNKDSWGSYYDDKPNVVLGDLNYAINNLKQHPVTGFIIENYQSTIVDIAASITRS